MSVVLSQVGTITVGQSLSSSVSLFTAVPYCVILPAAWTAANISFQVSVKGSVWSVLYSEDGTEYTVNTGGYTAASGSPLVYRAIVLDGTKFAGVQFLKIQSGTSAAPVVQAGGVDRTLAVSMRDLG